MADGRHFENRYIAISQRKNLPILTKFCIQQQILKWMNVTHVTLVPNEKVALERLPSSTERISCVHNKTKHFALHQLVVENGHSH